MRMKRTSKEIVPSKWALRVLSWFCPSDLYETIEGDLLEQFEIDVKEVGEKMARRRLVWNAIDFFRSGIVLRNKLSIDLNSSYMILNNIRFSLRHLGRQRLHSTLHIVGLTLGMSVCLLIGLFLKYELSFDTYHDRPDRIYRVNSIWTEGVKKFELYATPIPLAAALRSEVTGLEHAALVRPQFKSVVQINPQKLFKQEHVLIVEPEFINIFKVDVISGDGRKALTDPYQAILSESIAKKFYGEEDPMGKTFLFRNKFLITVAGVMRDLPSNTSLPASMLLSYVANEDFLENGDTWFFGGIAWTKLSASTYIVLSENYDPNEFKAQLRRIADKNINAAPTIDKVIRGDFEIQALREIHFDTKHFRGGPWIAAVDRSLLWFFAAIGLIVLTLACVNFLNLSTAQAMTRAKEVGIRKSIGARRSQLISQFLIEACFLTGFSGGLSLIIANLSLGPINGLLGKGIAFHPLQTPEILIAIFGGIIVTSLLAGLYPAWVMARFNPMLTLKSGSSLGDIHANSWLRKGLVVSQFTISAALLIVVLIISKQIDFMRNKDLGFETDNVINVETGAYNKAKVLAEELRRIPGVKDVSLTRTSPISDDHWWNTMSLTENSERQSVCAIYADDHFFSLFGLKLLSGRIPFGSEYKSDSASSNHSLSKVIVNEKLLQALGLGPSQEAIGKHFWWGGDTEITGVVADFNAEPLYSAIVPTLIMQDPSVYSQISIKVQPMQDLAKTLITIEATWRKVFPDDVFEYKFLDNQIDSYYKTETTFNSLFKVFAGIAILISCLGLWGLITFAAQRRTKEIGIRKVMGASVNAIVRLLSKDFVVMVLIAFAISSPLTYLAMNELLQLFAYRVDIGWEVFATTGISLVLLALLTISFQTIKAALANPIDSLKSE